MRGLHASSGNAAPGNQAVVQNTSQPHHPRGVGVQINQNIFNGFRTDNSVRQADSTVLQRARDVCGTTSRTCCSTAATAYMNVLRDTAILNLQRNNVEVLEEQLRQTQDRFNVGEVTRTDVAQAEARLAGARSDASSAAGQPAHQHRSLPAGHRRRAPRARRRPARSSACLPRTLDAALTARPSRSIRPIQAALHAVDAAELQVKVTEGELAAQRRLQGSVAHAATHQSPRSTGQLAPRSSARCRCRSTRAGRSLRAHAAGQGDGRPARASRPI